MRAVRFYQYGGPEVLQLEEVPIPEPGEGEVLLRVYATSVRRSDLSQRAGRENYFRATLPFQLGRESSGVVSGVGPGVEGWKEGDEAITTNITPCGSCDNCRLNWPEMCRRPRYQGVSSWGGYADYVALPAGSLMRKPPELAHDQAAGFQGGLLTAWHNLVGRGRLRAGETLLVPSASGAVASAGVIVGAYAGARVIAATSSPDKAGRIAALGADAVIDTSSTDLGQRLSDLTAGRGADLLFDTVGGDEFHRRAALVCSGGRIVMPGSSAGNELRFPISALIQNQVDLLFSKGSRPDEAALVLSLLAAGKLRVPIGQIFPLERTGDAHRCLENRSQVGRVVLDVAGAGFQPNI